MIIIAHRFSSIKHADSILVFEQGKVIEQGTHPELMSSRNYYYNLYKEQMPTDSEKDTVSLEPEVALAK